MEDTTTPISPGVALHRILRAFSEDETAFTAKAIELASAETVEVAGERFLQLAGRAEFEAFFTWLSRHADDLLSPCRWLVFGPNLGEGRGAVVPTLNHLMRLLQLIRERCPVLLDFTNQLITTGVLAKAAGVQVVAPPHHQPVAKSPSSANAAVAP